MSQPIRSRSSLTAALGLFWLCCAGAGCTAVESLFTPAFLEAVAGGSQAASIPGDAPAVLVEVENRTARVAEAQISWRAPDQQPQFSTFRLLPGDRLNHVLICPLEELTLGDVGDLSAPGVFMRLGEGGENDPFVEVEPFGVLLREGVNFDCGDSVTFTIQTSSLTLSGYQTFAFIRRAAAP